MFITTMDADWLLKKMKGNVIKRSEERAGLVPRLWSTFVLFFFWRYDALDEMGSPDLNFSSVFLLLQVPNVAVIVTDGRPQDRVAEVAAEARERGIEIFAVGVARADMTSLRAMASLPFEDHVFLEESFDLIHQFGLQFQDAFCGEARSSVLENMAGKGHDKPHKRASKFRQKLFLWI